MTNTVVKLLDRVEVMKDFLQSLGSGVTCNIIDIGKVELTVEVEKYLLRRECLTTIRH